MLTVIEDPAERLEHWSKLSAKRNVSAHLQGAHVCGVIVGSIPAARSPLRKSALHSLTPKAIITTWILATQNSDLVQSLNDNLSAVRRGNE